MNRKVGSKDYLNSTLVDQGIVEEDGSAGGGLGLKGYNGHDGLARGIAVVRGNGECSNVAAEGEEVGQDLCWKKMRRAGHKMKAARRTL